MTTRLVHLAIDPDKVQAGPVALLIVVLLMVALVFLLRSMVTHLRRVPASFDPGAGGPGGHDSKPDADLPGGRSRAR